MQSPFCSSFLPRPFPERRTPERRRRIVSTPGAGKLTGKGRDDLLFRAGVSMGKLYVQSGRSTQAVALLRSVITSAPSGAPLDEAYNTLGLVYYYERLYDDAIFEMRKAIELDPRFIEARHRLGVELYLAGNATEALKELRRASSVTAEYRKMYEIRYAEGLALMRLDRTGEAMGRFEQTVQARPAFAPAHNEIGKILLAREEYDAAIDHFVKAIGSDPRAEYARGLQVAMSRKTKKQTADTPK